MISGQDGEEDEEDGEEEISEVRGRMVKRRFDSGGWCYSKDDGGMSPGGGCIQGEESGW